MGTVLRTREFGSDLTLAESSVSRWPQGRARVTLARAYRAAGRQSEGLSQLRLAVTDYPAARVALATDLLAGGNGAEAASIAAEFIRLAPNHPQVNTAHELMGRAYLLDGRLDLAGEKFDLLTRATPSDPAPFARLGDIRLRQRRFDEAIAHYQTALSLRPNDADLYRQMGLALSASRRMEDAVEAFSRAVAARPTDISLLNFLGRTLGALGRYQEAVLPLKRLVELAPTDSQARQNLAIVERLAQAQLQAEKEESLSYATAEDAARDFSRGVRLWVDERHRALVDEQRKLTERLRELEPLVAAYALVATDAASGGRGEGTGDA